jgi:tetratricopeptide (TPR) repeat protein
MRFPIMDGTSSFVAARVERMTIPTYPALEPDQNPMFFESRNIQGSKGNIYPHPYIDRLSGEMADRDYTAVIIENEFLELVLLPELGGRIFTGLDKTNGYDFFYRHKVIKPALIGLFGPWISGGVEFNWPQHHRPSTFDPTDFTIEEHADGSKTVWMSEHDPLNRTRGMVGICLYPGKAFVETKVRLYNRTPFPQTFLWWANAGVHINEKYQVIFPPDVHHAVFHVKNPVTAYPIAKGVFNSGIDYGAGTDVSYWANSPSPSSFFAAESKYEFFGGYDHTRGAGVVHVADAGISPGKKFFTWANGPFGHQWQRNLMDDTGEYLELMAGVFTDNQPDFSWIMPHETRAFSQFWFPVQKIGAMKNANTRAAVNLDVQDSTAWIGVYATETLPGARISLSAANHVLMERVVDLAPGKPFTAEVNLAGEIDGGELTLRVLSASGAEIIRYTPEAAWDGSLPEPYQPVPVPGAVDQVEQLYLIGLHLEQYRHPTLSPEAYWEEGLRRDPGDARCNLALGKSLLRRGLFAQAEAHLRKSTARLTAWNLNPSDGEAHYTLGLALQYQGRLDEAYKVFYKAVWNYAWQSAGYFALAQIDLRRMNTTRALDHLERALQVNILSGKVRNLKAAALRRGRDAAGAAALAAETMRLDPLDFWARYEHALAVELEGDAAAARTGLDQMKQLMRGEVQTYLDIAFDLAAAGLYLEAGRLLRIAAESGDLYPMAGYTLGWLKELEGSAEEAALWYAKAAAAAPDYCFPWRLEELGVLEHVTRSHPEDGRAAYYLGNLLYDKRRYAEAIELWRRSAAREPGFSIPWRNLGLAAYNVQHDLDGALELFEKAQAANPDDPRLLLEYDHLLRRKAAPPETRLGLLESKRTLVDQRDDLIVHLMGLNNRLGMPQRALDIASQHTFHAWEGGEGTVAGEYSSAHWILGNQALEAGDVKSALEHFLAGLVFPENLGEHPFEDATIPLVYSAGLAFAALGQPLEAQAAFDRVRAYQGELSQAGIYAALALRQQGDAEAARSALKEIKQRAEEAAEKPFAWNYFYSGNPNPTFEEDMQKEQRRSCTLLAGLAAAALEDAPGARSALGQVLALDPANLEAWEAYRRLPGIH